MEYLTLIALVMVYSSLSSKISRITNNMSVKKNKKFPSLKELVGKNIELETDDYYDYTFNLKTKGILKEYNDTWIVIESLNKQNEKELYYYRVNDIKTINIIDK